MRIFALLFALLTAPCAHADEPVGNLRIVTNTLLTGLDEAPASRTTFLALKQLKDHPAEHTIFLHAFNKTTLVFAVTQRVSPPPTPQPVLRSLQFEVLQRIEIPRTQRAVDTFGVGPTLRQYEEGVCGVVIGQQLDELVANLGKPESVMHLQAAGCQQHQYGQLYVSLCAMGQTVTAVTDIPADQCPK